MDLFSLVGTLLTTYPISSGAAVALVIIIIFKEPLSKWITTWSVSDAVLVFKDITKARQALTELELTHEQSLERLVEESHVSRENDSFLAEQEANQQLNKIAEDLINFLKAEVIGKQQSILSQLNTQRNAQDTDIAALKEQLQQLNSIVIAYFSDKNNK